MMKADRELKSNQIWMEERSYERYSPTYLSKVKNSKTLSHIPEHLFAKSEMGEKEKKKWEKECC